MYKRLVGLVLGLAFVGGFLFTQAAVASTTQTLIVGGKMTFCALCGTVVSCMQGEPS
jgi:hypothetical protein